MRASLPNRARCLRGALAGTWVALALAGCAVSPLPAPQPPKVAPGWSAPVSQTVASLPIADWWSSWNDPLLSALIGAAQANSPRVDIAQARLAQARAALGLTQAAAWPLVVGNAQASRADAGPTTPGPISQVALSTQARWEIDLWGQNRLARDAAARRIDARQVEAAALAQTLAAEVATLYVNLRVAQAVLQGLEADLQSRSATARLLRRKMEAGFEAPAQASLAEAAEREAQARVAQQRAQIEQLTLALAALTTLEVSELRARLIPASRVDVHAGLPRPPMLPVPGLPSLLLRQRPDLRVLELELAALAAEVGVAEADRYPSLTLTGTIGYGVGRTLGLTGQGATWGFGPAITLPLFDAGRRTAAVELARARHEELRAQYQLLATQAVREVEEALLALRDSEARRETLSAALAGYEAFERAAEARHRAGVGSLLELEEARRRVLGARLALLALERERLVALVSLHRALGGGVDAERVLAADTDRPPSSTSGSTP
ncbi:MAG: efflux transporter outer membrane subunit [Casimicrobiaceae bacterium]|nr:efflux transporter outer membrane subunit [Casimicrobiaceae bacterium]